MVLFVMFTVPVTLFVMPLPKPSNELLPEIVLLVISTVPVLLFNMPPPPSPMPPWAVLLETVTDVMVSVSVLLLNMQPPMVCPSTRGALPLVSVSPESVTSIAGVTLPMLNTRTELLPLMVSKLAAGPWIVRFLSIASSALSMIGLSTVLANVIVQPSQASRIAWRSEPAPLSLLFTTTGFIAQVAALTPAPWLPDSSTRLIASEMAKNVMPILKPVFILPGFNWTECAVKSTVLGRFARMFLLLSSQKWRLSGQRLNARSVPSQAAVAASKLGHNKAAIRTEYQAMSGNKRNLKH